MIVSDIWIHYENGHELEPSLSMVFCFTLPFDILPERVIASLDKITLWWVALVTAGVLCACISCQDLCIVRFVSFLNMPYIYTNSSFTIFVDFIWSRVSRISA